jgi:hypothetical protein
MLLNVLNGQMTLPATPFKRDSAALSKLRIIDNDTLNSSRTKKIMKIKADMPIL